MTVSGTIIDAGSGTDGGSAGFAVMDSYGKRQPAGSFVLRPDGSYSFEIDLEASRKGTDKDDRRYTLTVSGKDNAGNVGSCSTTVIVPHDLRK